MCAKRAVLVLTIGCIWLMSFAPVISAQTIPSELQEIGLFFTEVDITGDREFVEIYNSGQVPVLPESDTSTSWFFEYACSSMFTTVAGQPAVDWKKPSTCLNKVPIAGQILPEQAYLIRNEPITLENGAVQTKLKGLANTTGAIRIVSIINSVETVYDQLIWKDGKLVGRSDFIPAKDKAVSVQRRLDDAGDFTDWMYATATPGLVEVEAVVVPPADDQSPPADDPATLGDTPVTPGEEPTAPTNPNDGLEMPYITELLPNPSSDESDEFIELYNPNDEPFNLKGYELQTGVSSVHSFVITSDTLLPPETYTILAYTDTKLALSNTGGRARLLNPAKQIVSETDVYGTAKEAWAWAQTSDGVWKWTDTVTPKLANVFTDGSISPLSALAMSKSAKNAKVKGVSTKKVKVAKVAKVKKAKKAKAPKLKKTKKKKSASTQQLATIPSAAEKTATIHPVALVAVATGALAYIAYEYRKDLANIVAKLRRH